MSVNQHQFTELNEAQIEAETVNGPLLVLAGAERVNQSSTLDYLIFSK